jgi:flagellar motor switch protein FliM
MKLTSAIPCDTIDSRILTHLEESLITALAASVMATMPRATNPVSFFPSLFSGTNSHYGADNFVSKNEVIVGATSPL